MALQHYIERGAAILHERYTGLFLWAEVYKVTGIRVRHKRPGEDTWQCCRCLKAIEDGDTYRNIVTRRRGTKWTDRAEYRIHNTCFMGKNVRGFA